MVMLADALPMLLQRLNLDHASLAWQYGERTMTFGQLMSGASLRRNQVRLSANEKTFRVAQLPQRRGAPFRKFDVYRRAMGSFKIIGRRPPIIVELRKMASLISKENFSSR
jgi:hypothetical protein